MLHRHLALYQIVFSQLIDRVPDAIIGVQLDNQEQNEYLHVAFVLEDQADVSVLRLEGDAIPCVEWHAFLPLIVIRFTLLGLLRVGRRLSIAWLLLAQLRFALGPLGVVSNQLVQPHPHHPEASRERPVNESLYFFQL